MSQVALRPLPSIHPLPFIALLGVACATGPKVPEEPLVPVQVYKQRATQLPSGLRVMVQEDHNAPLVAVTVVVGTGAAEDPAGQEGLAHLVEHLTYRPVGERLKRAGTSFNGTTEPDRTTYFELGHKDHLADLLAIEGARLAQPLAGITPEVFETERDVVRNELRERDINPRVVGALWKRAFPGGHPLARVPAAGMPLAAATLASAQAFIDRHYLPSNITVVVAGDVTPEVVLTEVERWAPALLAPSATAKRAPMPQPSAQPPKPVRPALPPPPNAHPIERITVPVEGRHLIVAWPTPPDTRAGDPFLRASLAALEMRLLVGYLDGFADADFVSSAHGSLLMVEVELKPETDPEKARENVLDAIGHVGAGTVARVLTGRMKWYTATNLMRRSSDLLSSSVAVAHYLAATGLTTYYRDTLSQLAQVNGLEVSEFLDEIVSRERAVTLLIEPEQGASDERDKLTANDDASKHELASNDVVSLVGMGGDDLMAMMRSPRLAELPRFQLQNGVRVVVVPQAKDTAVAGLSFQLPVGDLHLSPYGVGSLAHSLARGDCRYDDYLLEVGGNLSTWSRDLPRRFEVQVFAGNLANGLAAVGNRLRCQELDANAMDYLKRRLERQAEAEATAAKKPGNQARLAFWDHLYPDGGYGLTNRGLAALRKLDEAELEAALHAQFQPAGSLAVVVSDRPQAELASLLETHLGSWKEPPAQTVLMRAPVAPARPGRSVKVFQAERPGAQTSVRVGCRLSPVTDETLPAHDLLEAVIDREANQVRASWGASYGFRVATEHLPRGIAHLTVAGAIENARAADAVARMFKLFEQLAANGPDIKSFLLERWDLGRAFNLRFATAAGRAAALLDAADQGFAPTVWDNYPQRLADLSRTGLRTHLEPCVGRESVTLIGDKAALERDLRDRGLLP
jgi:zinc protease